MVRPARTIWCPGQSRTTSSSPHPSALGDVNANRRRIVILKIPQIRIPHSLQLIADSLTGWAREGSNGIRVPRCNNSHAIRCLLTRRSGIRRAIRSDTIKQREGNASVPAECERRSFKLVLCWEEEDEGAGLAGVGSGNVEVVDCGDCGGDFAEVACAGWDGWCV